MSRNRIIEIKGGAGPAHAAAIAAAIAHAEAAEADTRATIPPVPRPSSWVQATRARTTAPPMRSSVFDATAQLPPDEAPTP
ncbi:MAG: hypothetical protein BMS9Abin07_0742 [Acidimicrobiia bacterium]|nr:MAG: hypothetical protein BMS9Abin07_0742 [Acidimicrobiia bacterium]